MKERYEKPHMVIQTIELATLAGCYGWEGPSYWLKWFSCFNLCCN